MTKQFFRYVFQNVSAMIGISVYILADTFFISICSGADGLAVLNLILPLFGLIYGIGAMTGIGFAASYTMKQACGQNADSHFTQSVFWSLLASLPFFLCGIFCPSELLLLLGADEGLRELGSGYIRIVLLGSPFFLCNYTFTAFLRNDYAAKLAMVASLMGSLFNIIFDYVFMFPMKLGFTGAALATIFSPAVTMLVCSFHFKSKKCRIRFQWKKPNMKRLFRAYSLGAPAFVGEISSAIITLTFNMLILKIAGNTGVAAYGVIANISLVVMAVFNGIAQGTQPLVSENYGLGNKKNLTQILKLGIFTSAAFMILAEGAGWIFTDPLIALFNSEGDELLREYAFTGMRLYFLGYIFASVNIYLLTYFAAADRTKLAMTGSILRGFAAILFFAFVLSEIWGLNGIWLSFAFSEAFTGLVILILAGRKQKHIRRC